MPVAPDTRTERGSRGPDARLILYTKLRLGIEIVGAVSPRVGLVVFHRECDLDVRPELGKPTPLDLRRHSLDVDPADVLHGLGGLGHRIAYGVVEALRRTPYQFNHLADVTNL